MNVGNTIKELNEVIGNLLLIRHFRNTKTIKSMTLTAMSNLGVDGNVISLVFILNENRDEPILRELLKRELVHSDKLMSMIHTIDWKQINYDSSHMFICHIVY